jgi:hypothetical protein
LKPPEHSLENSRTFFESCVFFFHKIIRNFCGGKHKHTPQQQKKLEPQNPFNLSPDHKMSPAIKIKVLFVGDTATGKSVAISVVRHRFDPNPAPTFGDNCKCFVFLTRRKN